MSIYCLVLSFVLFISNLNIQWSTHNFNLEVSVCAAVQILSILQKHKGLQVLDTVVDVPGKSQEPCKKVDAGKTNEDPDIGNCPEDLTSSKCKF